MTNRPNHLRIVRHTLVEPPSDHPKRFTIYEPKPDLFQALDRVERRVLREAGFPLTLWEEIRSQPVSHALVAVLTIVGWTLLLILPMLVGVGK